MSTRKTETSFNGRYQRLLPKTISSTATLQMYVLSLLAQKDEAMSGREIMEQLRQRTGWEPGHGTVYQMLNDMAAKTSPSGDAIEPMLEWIDLPNPPGRERPLPNKPIPYKITEHGRKALVGYLAEQREKAIEVLTGQLRLFSDIYDPSIVKEVTDRVLHPSEGNEE